jgi:uncharacterized protein (DUF342 family)
MAIFFGGLSRTQEAWLHAQADTLNKTLARVEAALARIETKMKTLQDNLDVVIADVTAENTVIDGAIKFIESVPGLIKTAVDAALAQGATPAQLQSLTDLGTAITAKKDALAAALAAPGTP